MAKINRFRFNTTQRAKVIVQLQNLSIFPLKYDMFNLYARFWRHKFSNIIRSASLVLWITENLATSQTHEFAFGKINTFPLHNKYQGCTLFSSSKGRKTLLAVWTGGRREILLCYFDSAFKSVEYKIKYTNFEFDHLYTADLNGDNKPDFLLANKRDKSIGIVLDISPDTLKIKNIIKLPIEPEQILIGDYNNDKRVDLLIYEHKLPGILPLIGNGRGGFSAGKIFAQDNAVGAVNFAQVNNDNLVDLIIWDWIKSELHVLYGVGKGRFIDQSVFPVDGEVDEIFTMPIARKHTNDIVLKMTRPSEIQIWEGNDFGDFQLKHHIPFEKKITDLNFADVNNDGLNDFIVTLDPPSLQVVFNNDIDPFTDRIEYACGNDPQKIIIPYRQSKTGIENCIIFDRNDEQFITYKNVMNSEAFSDSVTLTTGVLPTEIITNDFNHDGISDIALINKKSKSISLYYGHKSCAPIGPYSYSLAEEPGNLSFHSSTDTSLQMLITFPQSNQISYFTIDVAENSISNTFIGSEGNTQILDAAMGNHKKAEFVTMNTATPEGNFLSFYEQLESTTFIERTFHLLPPNTLLGASVADLNNDHFTDIVYLYRTGDTSTAELGVAFGDSNYSMKLRLVSKEFYFPNVKQVYIWLTDFDKDGIPDLMLYAGTPMNYMLVAKGKGDGLFRSPIKIAADLKIEERSDVQIVDLDSDGFADIVIGSQKLKQVLWLRNRGECNFESLKTLITEPELNHFVVTDINADGVKDLAMTLTKSGILKIISGKALPIHANTSVR